jgi:hypothetical protein
MNARTFSSFRNLAMFALGLVMTFIMSASAQAQNMAETNISGLPESAFPLNITYNGAKGSQTVSHGANGSLKTPIGPIGDFVSMQVNGVDIPDRQPTPVQVQGMIIIVVREHYYLGGGWWLVRTTVYILP